MCARGGRTERGGPRIWSGLCADSGRPDMGFEPTIHEMSWSQMLNHLSRHPRAPIPFSSRSYAKYSVQFPYHSFTLAKALVPRHGLGNAVCDSDSFSCIGRAVRDNPRGGKAATREKPHFPQMEQVQHCAPSLISGWCHYSDLCLSNVLFLHIPRTVCTSDLFWFILAQKFSFFHYSCNCWLQSRSQNSSAGGKECGF